jgi:hypothetical protein
VSPLTALEAGDQRPRCSDGRAGTIWIGSDVV